MAIKNSTVLIVDDQLSAREVLRGLLTGQGYDLVFATNGEEALGKAQEQVPDIVLLDVMMPGMDGFEVCERFRRDPRLAEVPVLLITALDDRDSRLRGIKAGADDFISKPFDQIELRARVQTITQLNRYRRLHTERAKFEWVVEQANYGYLVITEQGKLVYANSQARHYLGLSEEAELPTAETFLDIVKKQYNCEPLEIWENWPHLNNNQSPAYLVRPASEHSHSLWLQVEEMEMSSHTDERHLVHLRDVTSEVADRRMMWTFHAQIGHKLRTPVMLTSGFLDMLMADQDAFSEEHKHIIASAYRNARRLQSQIQDILRYVDTPLLASLELEICNLSEIVSIVDRLKTELEFDTVSVSILAEPANIKPKCLALSRPALALILQELLENSVKFHPTQNPTVSVNVFPCETELQIQVQDDGITLSSDELAKMWMPYYQVEKYFTGQVVGMGLGLATVASLVWDVGGTCHAFNRPDGRGLIIELILPLKEVTDDYE